MAREGIHTWDQFEEAPPGQTSVGEAVSLVAVAGLVDVQIGHRGDSGPRRKKMS